MNKTNFFIIALLLLISSYAHSKPVRVVTLNWGGFIGSQLPNQGPHGVIIKEAFQRVNKEVEFKFYPWARAYQIALSGQAFLVSASDTKERRKLFNYSDSYASSPSYLISLKKSKFNYQGVPSTLNQQRIGVLRGHFLAKLLQKFDLEKNIELANSDVANLQKFFSGRVDLVAMSKDSAISIIKNNPNIQGTLEQVEFLEPPLRTNPVHLIGLKNMTESKEVIKAFNMGLNELKEEGRYYEILQSYGFK
ncbi:transporter substrate-binding domain-containing protein [Vibrio profundum]|uniref:substrate-binding periplasmic protein n=1 Tax=Vibrio profundum TaxID=2910247 RepID=UPI003D143A0D